MTASIASAATRSRETVVAGMIVGEFIADFCDDARNDASIPTALVREFVAAEQGKLRRDGGAAGAPRAATRSRRRCR